MFCKLNVYCVGILLITFTIRAAMVQFTGMYRLYKSEHILEYLLNLGVPRDKAELYANDNNGLMTVKEENDGKTFLIESHCCAKTFVQRFTLGQEVDEFVTPLLTVKSTAMKLGENKIEISSRHSKATMPKRRILEFNDTSLIITLVSDKPGGLVAKRYYERISS